jgi:integrase
VKEQRAKGATQLFSELSKGRDGYGAIPSKWFARFKDRIGLTHQTFHGLRHTVVNKLREAGVPEDVVADIIGHSRSEKETYSRYAKAASVKRTYDALTKLRYER